MIGRISQSYTKNQFIFNEQNTTKELEKTQDSLSSGKRVRLASDDPTATFWNMHHDSKIKEIDSFTRTIDDVTSKTNLQDAALGDAIDVMQRMREVAVQAANGVYEAEDRKDMAVEIDQLIRQLVSASNGEYKGNALFAGTALVDKAFTFTENTNKDLGVSLVNQISYEGNSQSSISEIDKRSFVHVPTAGNEIFWTRNMGIYSNHNLSNFVAENNGAILIDGYQIDISTGDTPQVIAQKINDAPLAIEASTYNQNGEIAFQLETTAPHQITLQDINGGNTLQSMGFITAGNTPNNYDPTARVFSGSFFDTMLEFRDALLDNDNTKIGSNVLGDIDLSLSNVLQSRANIGAIASRMEITKDRLSNDKMYHTDAAKNAIGTDVSEAMMNFKMLEFSHTIALNMGARLIPPTLLDFLR